jgi:hypothetical protein
MSYDGVERESRRTDVRRGRRRVTWNPAIYVGRGTVKFGETPSVRNLGNNWKVASGGELFRLEAARNSPFCEAGSGNCAFRDVRTAR